MNSKKEMSITPGHPLFILSYFDCNLSASTAVLIVPYPCCVQHPLGSDHGRGVRIFVAVVHHGLDPGLDDCVSPVPVTGITV